VLTKEEIGALSDDPAEMLQQLLDLAGGNATVRVDGFLSGELPPKALIKSIQISRDRFAAEHHSPDFDEIQIVTEAGVGPLRGSVAWRVRDGSMSGRSPFTPIKAPEQTQRYQFDLGGTLIPHRASFALAGDRTRSFDTPMLNIALPDGTRRAEVASLRRPADSWSTYDLFDYAATASHILRVAYVQSGITRENLGVGAYDLASRAYTATAGDRAIRAQESGPLAAHVFGQTRFRLHWSDTAQRAVVEAPTMKVLDAFTSGGAQVTGSRHVRDFEFASDVDFDRGRHTVRAGVLLEGGGVRSDEASNYLGTYTFTSLATYEAGEASLYTRRIGDPLIRYDTLRAGAYVQDDVRLTKGLTISGGVRYEVQTHVHDLWNVGPRGAITWAPFKNGRTTLHASGGIFYEWLDANTYEQTLRVDGYRQRELVISNPVNTGAANTDADAASPNAATAASPNAATVASAANAGSVSASNRYQLSPTLRMPRTTRVDVGIDQTLSRAVRVNASYFEGHDLQVLRGRNLNPPSPIDGTRPNPAFANVIDVVSDAAFRGRQFQSNLTVNLAPPRGGKQTIRASYTLSSQESNSDGPFSVPASGTLATEWAPTFFNRRHRLAASITSQPIKNLSTSLNLAANTGTPYSITTGRDDNGDGLFNDRPAGVSRNSVRTRGAWTLSATVSYTRPLGPRYRLSWSANAVNLTNHANYSGYSGVMTSPFFLQPTSVQNPRKIDLGMTFSF
jgi:hypothetical protein